MVDDVVEAFIARAALLTAEELRAMTDLHRLQGDDSLRFARSEASAVAAASNTGLNIAHVEASIRDWCTRQLVVTGQESGAGMREADLTDARRRAGPALADSAVGLLLGDALSDAVRHALAGAFISVSESRPSV
jgi:hypothetical protein